MLIPIVLRVAVTVAAATPLPAALIETLAQSRLDDAGLAQTLAPRVPYDPALISVLASVRSRQPGPKRRWIRIRLPNAAPESPCPGPFEIYVRSSRGGCARRGSAPSFVVLPGSYATVRGGSFTNQTVAALDQAFGDPTIFAFPGFLTPEFLKACRDLPRDEFALAADLYRAWAGRFADACRGGCGVIGFSGGANLALGLLAADDPRAGGLDGFNRGALAISPILNKPTAFGNLDSRAEFGAPGLTTLDPANVRAFALALESPLDVIVEKMFRRGENDFHQRFFGEFARDLQKAKRAVGRPRSKGGYLATFGHDFRDLVGGLDGVSHPALLISSQDDPVLSAPVGHDQPERIGALLRRAANMPNVFVYNPRFGAHAGILLDPVFGPLVGRFFGNDR